MTEPEKNIPKIELQIRRNRLEAFVKVDFSPQTSPVTLEDLTKFLHSSGVIFGIDEPTLLWLTKAKSKNQICCAKGQAPIPGENAYLQYHVDIASQNRPVKLADGSIDFKNINKFLNVTAGDLLAEKIPPTEGVPGVDVFGLQVPPTPGRDFVLHPGKNVAVEDGIKLVAAIDGQLQIVHDRINVLPLLEIRSDIDYSTGNIDFVGSVIIHGSIQSDFSVKASGNIEVYGDINGGMATAAKIKVRQGIHGLNRSVIIARESVSAAFVENATIHAAKSVMIQNTVMNSLIFAGVSVQVIGRQGRIIGGRISAGEEIRLGSAGNEANVPTLLEVSGDPFLADELERLELQQKQAQSTAQELKNSLVYFMNRGIETFPSKKQAQYTKLLAQFQEVTEKQEDLQQRICEIEKVLSTLKPGKIHISHMVYPGVHLSIGQLFKNIIDPLQHLTLSVADDDIQITDYQK